MKVIVIGGGIIGYCSAYYLFKSGHDVTILEKNDSAESPSYHNAGMVVPSHFIPLASPGVITKGLKWILSSDSPFYIKPRFNMDLFRWLWQFYRHANQQHVDESVKVLLNLNITSNRLFDDIIQENPGLNVEKKSGLMMIYNTEKGRREETRIAEMANEIGVEANILNMDDVSEINPTVTYCANGAVHYPGDAFMSPEEFMNGIESILVNGGVNILKNEEVINFSMQGKRITHVLTSKENYTCDKVVLASGIHSFHLGKKLGLKLPMQGGKGYCITLPKPERIPSICSILTEAKVAVTPMNGDLRLAGTMEISGTNKNINYSRVKGYLSSVTRYLPEYSLDELQNQPVWAGLRPCTPDGNPYIGVPSDYENLVVCTGHAMMGFSLGPVSGKLVLELVDEKQTSIEIQKLHPDRFV